MEEGVKNSEEEDLKELRREIAERAKDIVDADIAEAAAQAGLSEKSIFLYFGLKAPDIRTYSPLPLAFIGDDVYGTIVRTLVVGRGNTAPAKLHSKCASIENAAAQTKVLAAIEEDLSEEEADVVRRGRNSKPRTMAKNATVSDYLSATGLEALIGYLYMQGKNGRILELVKMGLDRTKLL